MPFRYLQNVGVNGARVTSMAPPGIIKSFARDQKNDRPMIVFVSLIGNDVCNGRTGTGSMTTPTQFSTSVKNILKHLDNVLPTGSHVALIPLVDGRVLYDNTKTQTHPLGVSYSNFYDFLGCNNSNPCMGWLTSNSVSIPYSMHISITLIFILIAPTFRLCAMSQPTGPTV